MISCHTLTFSTCNISLPAAAHLYTGLPLPSSLVFNVLCVSSSGSSGASELFLGPPSQHSALISARDHIEHDKVGSPSWGGQAAWQRPTHSETGIDLRVSKSSGETWLPSAVIMAHVPSGNACPERKREVRRERAREGNSISIVHVAGVDEGSVTTLNISSTQR